MKKLIPLLIIALMVVILGSCVGNKEPIVLQDSEDTSQLGDQSPNEVSTDDTIINESDPIDDDICSPIQDVISAVPDGYISNSFATKIGHMREDGSVGFTDVTDDQQVTVSFILPTEWKFNGMSTADVGGTKVFEIGGVFPTAEFDAEKYRLFDDSTVFPTTVKNDENIEVTVYEEDVSYHDNYSYMIHQTTKLHNGEYEVYRYIFSDYHLNGYSVYVTFVVNEFYDEAVCQEVLQSIKIRDMSVAPTCYELDGRVSDYPIVIGEHEHNDCDDTDAELMALGQEKFDDAVKLYKTMMCLAPEDESKFIYDEYGNELYAMDEVFGTYDSIMELCGNTFAPGSGKWKGYVAVERPEELLDSGLIGLEVDGEYVSPRPITEALGQAMLVEDGVTYIILHSGWDSHILYTEVVGVMNHTDTHIEYRLCTTVLDESNAALAISDEIPQYFFEHSVMKLDLIDGKWLITQMRTELGNEIG